MTSSLTQQWVIFASITFHVRSEIANCNKIHFLPLKHFFLRKWNESRDFPLGHQNCSRRWPISAAPLKRDWRAPISHGDSEKKPRENFHSRNLGIIKNIIKIVNKYYYGLTDLSWRCSRKGALILINFYFILKIFIVSKFKLLIN